MRQYVASVPEKLKSVCHANILYFVHCASCYDSWYVNDQLDVQFFSMYLFQFSTRFEQPCVHHPGESIVSIQPLVYATLKIGE